jgi:hypothetical protein
MLQQGSKELTETFRKPPAGPGDIPAGARKFQETSESARKLPNNLHIGSFRPSKEASGGSQRLAIGQVEYIWIKAALRKALHGRPREAKEGQRSAGPSYILLGLFPATIDGDILNNRDIDT